MFEIGENFLALTKFENGAKFEFVYILKNVPSFHFEIGENFFTFLYYLKFAGNLNFGYILKCLKLAGNLKLLKF